jgi:cobalt-zinc-cadmium efflux system outer membrane protein
LDVVEVTWSDVVRHVDAHPRLVADSLQADAARRGLDAARAIPNPTFGYTLGRGSARDGDASRVETELEVSIPFGWIAERGPRLEAAQADIDVAMAESKSSRRDLLLQLRTHFLNLAYEQAHVKTLEALEAQTSRLVQSVRKRVETGEVRPVEGPLAEIELEKVASELEAARTMLGARQAALARWFAMAPGKRPVAAIELAALPSIVDRETALSRARATDPVLMTAMARSRLLAAEARIERRTRIPSVSLSGFDTAELDRTAYGVGISIEIPLWNWNTGRIARADAKLASGKRQVDAAVLEVETVVIEAQAACSASVGIAIRLRDKVVPRSENVVRTMERAYELGESSLLPVLDARRTQLESHRLYLNALVQAQIDASRLAALIGEELQ